MADFRVDFRLGRAHFKGIAAGAGYLGIGEIFGMYLFFGHMKYGRHYTCNLGINKGIGVDKPTVQLILINVNMMTAFLQLKKESPA
mgnify:FL=1